MLIHSLTALNMRFVKTPDIILVGEIRDRDTMESALNAETGHLVFSTIHTNSGFSKP